MSSSALIIAFLITFLYQFIDGVELYDPRIESCCNGKVQPKGHCGIGGCCGDHPFDVTSQVCCGGRLMPLSAGLRTSCCGNITYSVGSQVCCEGNQLVDVPEELACRQASDVGCCHGKPYSKVQSLCCNGQVVNKPIDSSQAKCCGNSVYVPGDEECCSGNVYKPNEMVCCGGFIQPRPLIDAQCCGPQLYDFRTHACCNGNLLALFVRRMSNASDGEMMCCGSQLFVNRAAICCEGVIHPVSEFEESHFMGCCGNETMDARNFICCEGVQIPLAAPTSACCENGIYDRKQQICCDGQVHEKPVENVGRFQDSILAIPEGSPVDGAVPPVIYPQYKCCGKSLYNIHENICCDKELVAKVANKTSCCTKFSQPVVITAIGNILLKFSQTQDFL